MVRRPYRGGALQEGPRSPREVQERTWAFGPENTGVWSPPPDTFYPRSLRIDTSRRWAVCCDAERVGFSDLGPSAYLREYSFEENGGYSLLSLDNEACLAWLDSALQQLRPEGQEKVVSYLEAVLEEVVFETKLAPRP